MKTSIGSCPLCKALTTNILKRCTHCDSLAYPKPIGGFLAEELEWLKHVSSLGAVTHAEAAELIEKLWKLQ